MRVYNGLWTILVSALGLLTWPVEGEAGYDYDSRRVYDICSPDQVQTADRVKIEWGHYRQWQTVNGTLSGPGSFVAAPWNTCVAAPDYTTVSWRGTGQVTFWLRGTRDGEPRGRGQPGSWSEWIKLAGSEQNLPIPEGLDGKQWVQLKAVLDESTTITEFSIHKRMVLPDHPRILLTADRIREVRERIVSNSEIASIYAHYIQHFKRRARATHSRTGRNCWTVGYHMTSLGIAWNLSGDDFFLDAAKEQLARLESPWAKGLGHFDRPQLLGGAATCLDLVWNGLTRPEQVRFTQALLVIADKQQKAWRFSDVSNQIYTNSGKNILTGLALAGANVDPAKERFYMRQAEDLIRNHLVPASNFWAADDGGWGEGHGYCDFTMNDWALEAHGWASATGEDIFQEANFFKFLPQWRVYERRYNGTLAKFNDSSEGSVRVPFPAHIASRWRDRIAQKQAKDELAEAMANPGDYSVTHLWQSVLWYDPELPAAADYSYPPTMPLGRHFAGVGHVVCRSGWGADDVLAIFKSGNAFTPGTHYHADENQFVIDRGGSLAIDSGSDDRTCDHYRQYFCRTIAHNTITVKKPGERFRADEGTSPNDGGQMGGDWLSLRGGKYDSAQWGMHIRPPLALRGITAFETNRQYTYAVGDAARAYGDGKVTEFTRQFLHLQPNTILIFDRVTAADPGYRKRWLLHTVDEPEVRGRTAIITHLRGRLFSQTLLPADAEVTALGGPGKEHWCDGRNYPIAVESKKCEPGAWRIEVFPGAARKSDCFLHYLYVTDPTVASAPPVALKDASDKVTVEFRADGTAALRAVTFNKTGPVGGAVTFVSPGRAPGQLETTPLATDVQPQRFDSEAIWE